MKATIVSQIHIVSDPQTVFEYLTNLKYHTLWNPHLRYISSNQRLQLGTKYKTISVVLNIKLEAHNTVTKFDEPHILELENSIGVLNWKINYKLKIKGKGVLTICTSQVSTDNKGFVFTAPILKQLAQRELQSDLHSLKIAVEHKLV